MNLTEAYKKIVAVTFDKLKGDAELQMLLLRFYKQAFGITPSGLCMRCIEGFYNKVINLKINEIKEMELTKTAELLDGHLIYFNNSHFSNISINDTIAMEYLKLTGNEEVFKTLPDEYLREKFEISTKQNNKKKHPKNDKIEEIEIEEIEIKENKEPAQ